MKQPLNIILLGDPGSGKATQAAYFVKKYDLYDFDTGRELTLAREKNKKIDTILIHNYDVGKLAPTKIVRKIMRDKIFRHPKGQGILFDGTPKMLGEAKLVHSWMRANGRTNVIFFYLSIPREAIVERVLKRKGYEVGKKYKKREMDSIAALKNRAVYYKKNIKEVVDFFSKHYSYNEINGMGTRLQVRRRIQKVIDQYLKQREQVH